MLASPQVYIRTGAAPTDYSLARIKNLLRLFIARFRTPAARFYMHTDTHAVAHVRAHLEEEGVHTDGWPEDLADPAWAPPAGAAAEVAAAMANLSVGVGCGHIRLMGQNPGLYGLQNPALVTNAVRADESARAGIATRRR